MPDSAHPVADRAGIEHPQRAGKNPEVRSYLGIRDSSAPQVVGDLNFQVQVQVPA